jgi:RNA polymerase sigma-54 factor
MKPSLQLRFSQQLALTPQLQQSIKLLQLSTLELNQEIERMLLENPMLEREGGEEDEGASQSLPEPQEASVATAGEEYSSERISSSEEEHEVAGVTDMPDSINEAYDSVSDDDIGEAAEWRSEGAARSGGDGEDGDFQDLQAAATSLRDHLLSQIALMPLSDRDRALAMLVIEALDDDGLLMQDLEELMPLIPAQWEVELEELSIALHQVQNLDPAGIGARDLQECLRLQLKTLPESELRRLALIVVDGNLDLLAARDFVKLKRRLSCNDDALRGVQELICSLNPRPGSKFADSETRYVVPDVVVRKYRGTWTVSLNSEAMPRLRIHKVYADILQHNRGVSSTLSSHLQEAKWLIKNVQQRFDTILRVSQAIVDRQRQFFEHGEVAMRPLTLREIAEELELHESTVSRVTTQKYMASARGVFELKYFFGSHVSTDTGGECSATAIRALIRQLVAAEDGKKPLSDARIAELLGQQGIVVARRTIAKYRESLNIPPVSQRKSI